MLAQLKHSLKLGFLSSHTEISYFRVEETSEALYTRIRAEMGF
jgi:hypothetical protein